MQSSKCRSPKEMRYLGLLEKAVDKCKGRPKVEKNVHRKRSCNENFKTNMKERTIVRFSKKLHAVKSVNEKRRFLK